MYSLYRNEPLQTLGIKITKLTDIIQLILITLFSIIYFKSAILFGAADCCPPLSFMVQRLQKVLPKKEILFCKLWEFKSDFNTELIV